MVFVTLCSLFVFFMGFYVILPPKSLCYSLLDLQPGSMRKHRVWPPAAIFFFTLLTFSNAGDSISQGQSISGGETLISADGGFILGFFSPRSFQLGFSSLQVSKNRYLGIWFNGFTEQTVVWVANREQPLTNSTGVLEIGNRGNLILRSRPAGTIIWSSTASNSSSLVAQLLDSGNLILKEATKNGGNSGNILWQSFDYPTDTMLTGMKIGWDLKTGLNRSLQSWKSSGDPSPGNYTYLMDPEGSPQMFLMDGLVRKHRCGPWNGLRFSGASETSWIVNYTFVYNQDEVYYSFVPANSSIISRLIVSPSGKVQRFVSFNGSNMWTLQWWAPSDNCFRYNECGDYGVCNSDNPSNCKCIQGFEPKSPDGSGGCVRMKPVECQKENRFLNLTKVKLPDLLHSTIDRNMSLENCKNTCLRDCSCNGYATADIRGTGNGCIMWIGDLKDIREYSDRGQNIFVRVAASVLDDGQTELSSHGSKNLVVVIVSTSVAFAILLLGFSGCYIWAKKKGVHVQMTAFGTKSYDPEESCSEDLAVPLYDLSTISTATNNFSEENKLGEGGFGPVYKGKLEEGKEIGVKRLSKDSVQGLDEFKNEVTLIAKLQHRNLVHLLGCCTQGEERMLIYEYMHNKSLDNFIFDETRRPFLNWQMRFDIIMGIARGLLYLHQDSRFKIVHRDLKASNILLDEQMNPKISDFGVARVSIDDLKDVKTGRVMGTYGYMSPEYAMDGIFSVKSDVFSFGVLVLEIISGKKNRGFYHLDTHLNLLGHAWSLWKECNILSLVDESMGCSSPASEVLKCIQVGLLCVQERAAERPTMSSVVFMLVSPNATLPQPKQPGFCELRSPNGSQRYPYEREEPFTSNGVTITRLESR